MTIEYERPPPPAPRRRPPASRIFAYGCSAYFAVSTLTLPLARRIWIGDLPVLVLPQLPKTLLAGWIRTGVIMPLMRRLGWSRGSFSPDYTIAGPYALVLTYLAPLAVAIAWRQASRHRSRLGPVLCLFSIECVDFLAFEVFIHTRGLSIY